MDKYHKPATRIPLTTNQLEKLELLLVNQDTTTTLPLGSLF
ncbi:hypothetical protein HMPREF1991_02867 [Hoylesella loescheii DSM 19665 = JCM 12249 = ATCC 15930]|uniref:Uncharacterized protein n=1 Tax=Hoylesella loescheii DSM 19665 = JCM 12249 = ATCC 15930 TaxID=1122985 RepID=A0A069QE50_HOYLO|nr:hypothetical protein HMPREF1991_02867 [Hoylesella loescheii DSM 19665 = JCM 12249 = ATCC 15930]